MNYCGRWTSLLSMVLPAAALLLVPAAGAGAVEIAKDGKAVATVVASGGPQETVETPTKGKGARKQAVRSERVAEDAAVKVLVDWIEKVTGARLPVATEAPPPARRSTWAGRPLRPG